MRWEIVASTAGFGLSSLFWCVAALKLPADKYGTIMQWQAALLMIVSVFSLRTHDLVFHLVKHYGYAVRRAYSDTVKLECGLVALATLTTWLLLDNVRFEMLRGLVESGHLGGMALLGSLMIFQGGAQALLRSEGGDRLIAAADLASSISYAVLLLLLLLGPLLPADILTGSMAAAATRPLVLLVAARIKSSKCEATSSIATKFPFRKISYFLLVGQATNILKNNIVAIETLILGRVSGTEAVALLRLARSFMNFTSVLLNLSYQKTFSALVACDTPGGQLQVLSKMRKMSLKLWVFSTPVIFIATFVFMSLRSDNAYDHLIWVIILASVASVPLALQQPEFARLSLNGEFGCINMAHLLALAWVVAWSFLWPAQLSIDGFMLITIGAAIVRYAVLRRFGSKVTVE